MWLPTVTGLINRTKVKQSNFKHYKIPSKHTNINWFTGTDDETINNAIVTCTASQKLSRVTSFDNCFC